MDLSPKNETPKNQSPSQRPSAKRPSFNSRQSGNYISQVRSLPTSNPIKQPLLEQNRQNRVASTENPRKYMNPTALSLQKEDSGQKNLNNDGILDRLTEDFNKKYNKLEEKLNLEIDRLSKDLKGRDIEIDGLKEKIKLKDRILEEFEQRVGKLNDDFMKKNEEFLKKMLEGKEAGIQEFLGNKINNLEERLREKELQIKLLSDKNNHDHGFLEEANALLKEKDKQLRELTEKIIDFKLLDNEKENIKKMEEKIEALLRELKNKDLLLNEKTQENKEINEKIMEIMKENDDLKDKNRDLNFKLSEKQGFIESLQSNLGIQNNQSPQTKHFSEFLQESNVEVKEFQEEKPFVLDLERKKSHEEKVKRGFAGESQHLQEKVKLLTKNLEEISKKYDDLLKEYQSKTFFYKESVDNNKTFPERGSLTTLYNDRFFGEQIQGILTKNKMLVDENQALKSQKSIKEENTEKMNKISREKIQENERLKKKLFLLQKDFEEVQSKWNSNFTVEDLKKENQALRSRLIEIEEIFNEKSEEELSRIKAELSFEQEKLIQAMSQKHKRETVELYLNYEARTQEILNLQATLHKIKAFLVENLGENTTINSFIKEINSIEEKKIEIPENPQQEQKPLVNEYLTELIQEKYHRKILESLVDLLKNKLLENSHLNEVQEILTDLENFSIAEENPYAENAQKDLAIQNLKEQINDLHIKLQHLDPSLKSFTNEPILEENAALKRELFKKNILLQKFSQQIEDLAGQYQENLEHYQGLEVNVLENFGTKAEKMLKESRIHQLKTVFRKEFKEKEAFICEKNNENFKIKALNRSIDDLNRELLQHKRRWLLISEEIQKEIDENNPVNTRILETFMQIKAEKNEEQSEFQWEKSHFLTDFNETQLKLAEKEQNLGNFLKKMDLFGDKFKEFVENNSDLGLDSLNDFFNNALNKVKGIETSLKDSHDQDLEELRLKYIQNALELENIKTSVSQDPSNIANINNASNPFTLKNSFTQPTISNLNENKVDFSFGEENKDLRQKILQLNADNEQLFKENQEILKQNNDLKTRLEDVAYEHEIIEANSKKLLDENENIKKEYLETLQKIDDISRQNFEISAENENLKKKIHLTSQQEFEEKKITSQNKIEFDELNYKLKTISEENEQIKKKNKDILNENENLTKNIQQVSAEIDALKKRLNGVYDENEELIRKNKKISHENEESQRSNNQISNEINKAASKNQELNKKLQEIYEENEKNKRKANEVGYENDFLKRKNIELSDEYNHLKRKMQEVSLEKEEVEKKNKENLLENDVLKRKISAISNEPKEIKQEKEFDTQYFELSKKLKGITEENEHLIKKNKEILYESETFSRKNLELSNENENLKRKIQEISFDNENLNRKFREVSWENDENKMKNLNIVKENSRLAEEKENLIQQNQNSIRKNQDLTHETLFLNEKIKQLKAENQQFNIFIEENRELRKKNDELNQENKDLFKEKQQLLYENQIKKFESSQNVKEKPFLDQEKQLEILNLQSKINELFEENKSLSLEKQAQQAQILTLHKHFEENQNVFKENQEFKVEIARLKAKISNYSDDPPQEKPNLENEEVLHESIGEKFDNGNTNNNNNGKIEKLLESRNSFNLEKPSVIDGSLEVERLFEVQKEEILHFNEIKTSFHESLKKNDIKNEFLIEKLQIVLDLHSKLVEFVNINEQKYLNFLRNQKKEFQNEFNQYTEKISDYLFDMLNKIEADLSLNQSDFSKNPNKHDIVLMVLNRLAQCFDHLLHRNHEISDKNSEIMSLYQEKINEHELLHTEKEKILSEKENLSQKIKDLANKMELLLKENEKLRGSFSKENTLHKLYFQNEDLNAILNEKNQVLTQTQEELEKLKQTKNSNISRMKSRIFALEDALDKARREKISYKSRELTESLNRPHENSEKTIILSDKIDVVKENEKLYREKTILIAQIEQMKVIVNNLKEELQFCQKFIMEKKKETEEFKLRTLDLLEFNGPEEFKGKLKKIVIEMQEITQERDKYLRELKLLKMKKT